MLKEAIEKIVSLAENKTYSIGTHTYADKPLVLIEEPVDRPQNCTVNGLDSAAKLVRNEIARVTCPIFIRVCDPRKVTIFTTYRDDCKRDLLYTVDCDVPQFAAGWREQDAAIIELRSKFIENDGVKYLIDLLSRIVKEDSVASSDNGVTQTVEARQGISLSSKVTVKPRVKLIPYRSFLEIEQPESEFLLRLDENGRIGLFEADGGMWQMDAKKRIADYFAVSLADLVKSGDVVVMV